MTDFFLVAYIIPSGVVLASLILALLCWIRIVPHTAGYARTAARCFVVCFSLYAFGQALALVQMTGHVKSLYAIPPVCYAVAAIIFGLGSWKQLKSYP